MATSDAKGPRTVQAALPLLSGRALQGIVLGLGFLVIAGTAIAAVGGFIIDEMIYVLGAHALSEAGSFAVENGWTTFRSDDLLLWLTVNGPNGVAPQYPPGTAVLGAPLYGAFGIRGMILPNAVAAAATLWLVFALARRLTGDATLALGAAGLLAFGTYFLEYAYGIWPHAIAVLVTTAALALTFLAHEEGPRTAAGRAVLAGLIIGIGMTFRADVILALPAIGAFVILYARAPVAMIAGGAAGLLPPVALLSLANQVKFGTYNPLSYGRFDGSGIDLANYLPLGGVVLLGLAGLVALRLTAWRPSRRIVIGAGLAALALAAALPATRHLLLTALHGIHVLVFDMTAINEGRPGVEPAGEATRLFWGLPKKALGQSLPWFGALLLLLAFRPEAKAARRWAIFSTIFTAIWMAPFIMRAWHGGLGLNMRYFLPVLPLLSILGALLMQRLMRESGIAARSVLLALLFGFAAVMAVSSASTSGLVAMHQPVSKTVFAVLTGLALLTVLSPALRPRLQRSATLLAAAGIGMAAGLGPVGDLGMSQARRDRADQISTALAREPGPTVIYGRPETMASLLARPDMLMAVGNRLTGVIDTGFVNAALAAGHRVLIETEARTLDELEGFRAFSPERILTIGPSRFVELGG
ncbi:glycosyltransferase family 39 protein [Ovoidimarina sediminis]|uniref:glycosyltransferase family 39 protein n=1 Tax=Ovoidimarina sediminis TaxID=3079856 RepID=UPI00290E0966|nr:hypothetical protein [Rhodophyticola sp. MJ-SS7]MDU8943256.1 hypothetical protein [Rhodophyticola sp. MJ-SS7]